MRVITALTGQTVFDIALQEMGSVEGAFDILEMNAFLRIDMSIPGGTKVLVPDKVISTPVKDYYDKNSLKPVSGLGEEVNINNQDMIYATQKVDYSISGGEKIFEAVRLWNLDNGNLTVQLNLKDITSGNNACVLEHSLDGINFNQIEETDVFIGTDSCYIFRLSGLLTNYARLHIYENAQETTGMITEIIWRQ